MRLKSAVLALSLSLLCLAPRVSFADTLTLTGVGGQSTDGIYIDPYIFTVNGPSGTSTNVFMSCLSFDREVSIGQTWNVNAIKVSSISSASTLDSEPGADFLADAYLYNQYAGAIGDAQQTSDIQFAIWSIMDPSGVLGHAGFTANAQALATTAKSVAPTLAPSYFSNDVVYVPSDSYPNGGEPQIFMTVTPEPSSLLLFGTGLLGMGAIMRRRFVQPNRIS